MARLKLLTLAAGLLALSGACTKKTNEAEPSAPKGAAAEAPVSPAAESTAGTASTAASASGSGPTAAAPAFDWKPTFAAAFVKAKDLKAPAKTRAPSAAEARVLAAGSPGLRATAPGSGYGDAQKGHCLVAALLQQNIEATADSYTLGGSIAVGACVVKLNAVNVPIKSGSVRFFRALACPNGKFGDAAKEKPAWARFRQAPELRGCAASPAVYVTEQVEATILVAAGKDKGAGEQTYKYLSARVGADGGPCVGTIEGGVVKYKGCVDFERIEAAGAGAKGKAAEPKVDFVSAAYGAAARAITAIDPGYATAAIDLSVDDWTGTMKAAAVGDAAIHLERGTDKVDVAAGEAAADETRVGAVREVLRALRRNLQTDPAAEITTPVAGPVAGPAPAPAPTAPASGTR